MRSFWVLVTFGLMLVCGLSIYFMQPPTADSRFIDMVTQSMRGIGGVVPPGSRLGVRRFVDYTMVNPINHYALASQNISLYENDSFDTLLVVMSSKPVDSVVTVATAGRKVLWQNRDSLFRYYITCSL